MTQRTPPPSRAYALAEGLHLRQWALRIVVPLAALSTNGLGRFDVGWLPRHDVAGWPADETALRVAGGVLVLAAAALRVAAKGVLVRKTTLTVGGVYRAVRHPFYLANLAGAVGTFLLAGSLGALVGAAWLLAAGPIFAATIAGEDAALRRIYPAQFDAWASRVRALVPTWSCRGPSATRVTWTNLVTEREPPRLVRFLAGAALVAGLTLPGPAGAAVLTLAALAFGLSYALR